MPTPADALAGDFCWTTIPGLEQLRTLPARPAVALLETDDGRPIQLAITQHVRRWLSARLLERQALPSRRADLADIARRLRFQPVDCPLEARWRHLCVARRVYPDSYRDQTGIRPVWFLSVDWSALTPEISLNDRVASAPAETIGPWPTRRDCDAALEGLRDIFDLCRHPQEWRRTPSGSRCDYADMGRCDAPCDGSVPLQPMIARTRAAWRFATGGIDAWISTAQQEMTAAAAGQRYELAALRKRQIQFAQAWQREWSPIVRPQRDLDLLLAIPATRRRAWKMLRFRDGRIVDGPTLGARRLAENVRGWLALGHDAFPCGMPDKSRQRRPPDDSLLEIEQTWLIGAFLWSREAARACVLHLVDGQPPDHWTDALAALTRRTPTT